MKLEEIGFYTLSDERAQNSSSTTPLWRCELLVTSKCNFRCPYCRRASNSNLTKDAALNILNIWINEGLKHVRFTGGEPTLWKHLEDVVKVCKSRGVERIAVSTNGSADLDVYKSLCNAGVSDFSISLDAGCCALGETMTGGIKGALDKVVSNIRGISKFSYVTVGIVFTPSNIEHACEVIEFADSLGVADIRVISSAQYNSAIEQLSNVSSEVLDRHPILKYRVENYRKGIQIRGISKDDCHKCKLVLDDMAVMGEYHYPCIIYLREGGKPIGRMNSEVRKERQEWYENHNSFADTICQKNCLDVCVAFNNAAAKKKESS